MNNRSILLIAGIALLAVAGAAGAYTRLHGKPAVVGDSVSAPAIGNAAAKQVASGGQSFPVGQNVRVEGGTQIIEIVAKGGYTPELTQAEAGMPTVIRIVTSDTFDCTSFVAIPALGYQARLPLSGSTDIPLEAQAQGATVTGVCGMAMYRFDIEFQG
jgi:hypothetical protein